MKKKTENVVFRAALEPLEAAAIKAKAPAPRGALHQAKSVWQRLEGTGGQRQNPGVRSTPPFSTSATPTPPLV